MARIPINCGCEDSPCCGCNEVMLTGEDALEAMQEEDDMMYADNEPFDGFLTDAEADGDALASAGMGTDEDYGFCEGYDE